MLPVRLLNFSPLKIRQMNKLLHAFLRKGKKSKRSTNWPGVLMLVLVMLASAFSPIGLTAQVIPTIDGNPIEWNRALPTDNFNLFAVKKYAPDAFGNGVVDNQFTEGSKDFFFANELVWSISQTKAKNDIANGAAIIHNNILYFAGDRTSNNGDAQIGFWLYLNGTAPTTISGNNIFSPPHVDGDVLVLADFTGGGRNANVLIYQWYSGANPLPPGTSIVPNTNGNLRTSTLVGTVAENNDGQYAIPTGWSFPSATYDYNMFYEGTVNLTGLGFTGANLCNATFLLETRSSQSITASLDDFVGGNFNITPPALVLTGDAICSTSPNTGEITSTSSQLGASYQLYNGANVAIQAPKIGTGAALTWTGLAAGNGYYVIGAGTLPVCTSTSNIVDITSIAPPTVTANDASVCIGATVQLVGTPAGGTWSGANVSASGLFNAAGLSAGPYVVTYSYTNSETGCSSSDPATVTVNAVTTATDPSDAIRCVGGASVTFTTTAGGTGPFTYQWSKDGSPIAGATNNSYTVSGPITAAHAGTYSVVVTGTCGTATQSATLTVNAVTTATDPSDAVRCVGGANVTFTTTAGGTGPFTYQWSKDGSPIAGATNASYTVTGPITAAQAGTYSVVVSGTCGTATQSATLTVNAVTTATDPSDASRCVGGASVVFTTTAGGTGPFTYQWSKDGSPIAGATNASYTVTGPVTLAQAGTYSVVVTGTCGTATQSATLTVTPVTTATDFDNAVRCIGGASVTFTTTAGGSGPFTYQWSKDGSPIAGATNASYTIAGPITVGQAGSYSVTVSGPCGSASQDATLTVNAVTTATDPSDAIRCVGGASVTFTTTAGGTGPFTYQWSKDGSPIAGATNASYTVAGPITMAQAGTYSVVVSGACGTATQSATLAVNPATTATDPSDAARCVGGASVTFTTVAGGTGPFTYQWSKDGSPIAGATNASYTVTGPITAAQGGVYSVTISGTCGTATQSATLTVNPLPVISCSATPTLIDITSAAHNTQMNVDLSGNADTDPTHYTYAWTEDGAGSFNFSNIKNPVYTAGVLDAGQVISFTVTVTNIATGCVSTSNCSVTVNSAGSCPGVPTSEVCNGSTNTYTADRAPTANETWLWSVNNGAAIVGAANGQSVTVTAGSEAFTLTLTVSYANVQLSPSVCTYQVATAPCGGYCTYTQGKYGNTSPACDGDGIGDGTPITYASVVDMIKAMLGVGGVANPMYIGGDGVTTPRITIPATATAAALLNKSMPGGGTARELIGSVTVDNVPSLPSLWTPGTNQLATYITKQGRINNVFLSQTIALGLNMRVSAGLGGFALEAGTFATAKADGGCGSTTPLQRSCYLNELGQLVVVNEYVYKTISQSVIDALTAKGYPLTVAGLYQLANDGLANADGILGTEGGAALADISGAAAAINEGFDECRISMGWNVGPCEIPSGRININTFGVINSPDLSAQSVQAIRVSAYPNPFADKVNFTIVSPVSGKASLEVYNMFGQKLQTVFEGNITAGRSQFVEYRPGTNAAGTLIYKFSIDGKQVTGKLINLKQ
jgi:hypothetical protein